MGFPFYGGVLQKPFSLISEVTPTITRQIHHKIYFTSRSILTLNEFYPLLYFGVYLKTLVKTGKRAMSSRCWLNKFSCPLGYSFDSCQLLYFHSWLLRKSLENTAKKGRIVRKKPVTCTCLLEFQFQLSGINIFLDGFVPTENLRFRDTSLVFKVAETADKVCVVERF